MVLLNTAKLLSLCACLLFIGCATTNEETYRAIPFNTSNISVENTAEALEGRYTQEEVSDCFYISNRAVSSALSSDAYSGNWQGATSSSFALKEYKLKQAQYSKSVWEKVYILQAGTSVTKVPTSNSAVKQFGSEILDSLMFKDASKVEAAKIDACTSPVLDEIDRPVTKNNAEGGV